MLRRAASAAARCASRALIPAAGGAPVALPRLAACPQAREAAAAARPAAAAAAAAARGFAAIPAGGSSYEQEDDWEDSDRYGKYKPDLDKYSDDLSPPRGGLRLAEWEDDWEEEDHHERFEVTPGSDFGLSNRKQRPPDGMEGGSDSFDLDRAGVPVSTTEWKLYVGNLPWGVDDLQLGDLFQPFGNLTETRIVLDDQTLCSRGFGFVTYATKEDMLAAIDAMDGHQVDGRDITVQIATGPVRGRDGTEKRWSAGAGYLAGKRRRR